MSEARDPEEVRDLLSGYFDLARSIVSRYGGVVEKFIGDAVMAVWGAPVTNEDDAERAVRAGLELVSAVSSYGQERSVELDARVGIVTGGAATTDAVDEGLVIGDRVNTAARIQSVAPPGCCYVDETTRAITAAAIAYTDAGVHDLKGKTERPHLYRASRVIAAVAGSQRANVLEAPFTGRDHELRLVKELFHASAERHSARMVLVSGVAGVGKSRLAWEFFKYIDGLAGTVLWHAGRCLSYGEGVSYWALSEMVRSRLQIGEEDPQNLVAERLESGIERWIPDASDREFILPRMLQLLGLPTAQTLPREELFAGWRLFFERLSEHEPVVMVVEDLQWADAGMVDFLDHLLEWSGDHAIFLLLLTRPEGTERTGLGLSRRSVTTLPIDPLDDDTMAELLDGFVADLPAAARASIIERAEGIPLYAVETIRSLLDKGVLAKDADGVLHLVGEIGTLEIPPGLTALIASRLDALSPEERRVVKECSVLGGSFPRQAVEAVTDTDPAELEATLSSLVRKEVLTVRADKLSPERGHYAFTQSLIRSVAYDMLSRGERKARHLRTAAHLRASFPDEGAEVAEVIASHLHDAYKASGDDPDADQLRAEAHTAYITAAERAISVGAPDSAETAYLRAVELSGDEGERADATENAGQMARQAGEMERAAALFESAVAAHKSAGRVVDAARVSASLSYAMDQLGHGEQAVALVRDALATLDPASAPPAVLAELEVRAAGGLLFTGHPYEAQESFEKALTLAQHHELFQTLAIALNGRGIFLFQMGRFEEARLNMEGGLSIARRHGLTHRQMISEINLTDVIMTRDEPHADEHAYAAIGLARRLGARADEAWAVSNLMHILTMLGRYDEADRLGADTLTSAEGTSGGPQVHIRLIELDALRGRLESAYAHLERCRDLADHDELQVRCGYAHAAGAVDLVEGRFQQCYEAELGTLDHALASRLPLSHEAVRMSLPNFVEAAIGASRVEQASELLERFSSRAPGELPPFTKAQMRRAGALLRAARGADNGIEGDLSAAIAAISEMGYPYWVGRAQLDLAEWLARRRRTDEAEPIAAAAAATFELLGAEPVLRRARAIATLDASMASPT